MLSEHRLCESDRVVHEGVCLAASHHDCVGWRVYINCELTPLRHSVVERACMLLTVSKHRLALLEQQLSVSPVVVQGWLQELREKSGGNLLSMSSSLHVSGTDTYTAAYISAAASALSQQAPASGRHRQNRPCAL